MAIEDSDSDVSPAEFGRIGREMMQRAILRAAGQETDYCVRGRPARRYYISNLTPEREKDEDDDLFTETTPSTIGLQVQPAGDELEVGVAFEIYIRSLPTYDEYIDETPDDFDPTADAFYVKEEIVFTGQFDYSADPTAEAERLTEALNDRLADAISALEETRVLHPAEPLGDVDDLMEGRSTDPTNLAEPEYESLIDSITDRPRLDHEWEIELAVEARDDDLEIRLTNDVPETAVTEPTGAVAAPVTAETCLFNPEIRLTGTLAPYELDVVSEDFRYDRQIWGKGMNCSVGLREDDCELSEDPPTKVAIETQTVPDHQTYRFVHRGEEDQYEADVEHLIEVDDTYDTSLESLWQEEPVETLRSMADGMRSYLTEWEGPLRRQKRDELTPQELDEFDEAAQKFRREIDNFERGIDALEKCPEGLRAFRMMNRAFAEQPDDVGIPGWRPFQLVFIVSNVSSLLAREYDEFASHRDDEAEVLWFPTGGGKTEAYLGLIVFGLFFDRLRGKERGVSAWIRFPLTLLGSQQLRRFLRVLTFANVVKDDLRLPGEPFSIGYYAGSGTTPNRIGGRNNLDTQFEGPNGDRILQDECQSIDYCPRCDAPIDVEWDAAEHAVHHVCTGTDCDVGRLPLYVTDHEIYRNVPSILLGTLDRITVVGSNPRFANLIGNITSECPVHGYGYSSKCSEWTTIKCEADLKTVDEQFYDPIPSLHLVDEVHLLGEELGVFAGHYETLYLELCEQLHGETPKIVTSTATISDRERGDGEPAYQRHVQNLFLRDANRFPVDGPELGESFYGTTTDERLRRYYGIAPRNKTHIYAVLDLVKQFHEVVRDFRERAATELDLDPEAKEKILEMYELSIVYFLRLTEKDRFTRSIENQIDREMEDDGYESSIELKQLTADVDDPDLESLEEPNAGFTERPDTIAATSFIGHGVDVERFNNMFFFGFPSRTFQYIQASNRVGRRVPGFVVDVFKPFDQRDRHRYRYFSKTHEYLSRAVEDVSVDRWSKFSLDKTFPGLFKGFFLQYFRPKMFREYDVNLQSAWDLQDFIDPEAGETYSGFSIDQLTEMLHRAYGVGPDGQDRPYFEDQIESRIESNWDFWLSRGTEEDYTQFREDEMHSLRDIGEDGEFDIEPREHSVYNFLVNQ